MHGGGNNRCLLRRRGIGPQTRRAANSRIPFSRSRRAATPMHLESSWAAAPRAPVPCGDAASEPAQRRCWSRTWPQRAIRPRCRRRSCCAMSPPASTCRHDCSSFRYAFSNPCAEWPGGRTWPLSSSGRWNSRRRIRLRSWHGGPARKRARASSGPYAR